MDDYLSGYSRIYKQYYKGDFSFVEFVLNELLNSIVPGSAPNIYDLDSTIKIILSLLQYIERSKSND